MEIASSLGSIIRISTCDLILFINFEVISRKARFSGKNY